MQCNLNGGRIYKGSSAQIDVFLYPACYTGVTDVVANFYTVSGQSIQKTDMVIEDGIATVLFQAVEIETFEDGLLRYNVSYVKDEQTHTQDMETRWFIKTPIPYTPIDYVTTANVTDVVENLITGDTGVSTEIQAQIDASVSGKADTSAVTQSLNTKQDRLTAGANISIVNNVISATGIPTSNSALTNDAGYATGSYVDTKVLSSVSGKADTTAVTQSLATKQDTLVAGPNIRMVGNVISVTGIPSMTSQLVNDSDYVNSTQVQTQIGNSISGKQDTLVSGTNIKTVNNQSLLGSGNIIITSATPTQYTAGANISIQNDVISVTGISVPTSNTALTNDAGYVNSGQVQTQINDSISGLSPYTAGTNIDIENNIISVTGITSYTGVTSQEIITALGYTPCQVTALTQTQFNQIQIKDANTIYGIIGD